MQKKKIILPLLSLILMFSFLTVTHTFANDSILSNDQAENLKANCSSIKNSLKQIQNSDRNTRISIGYTYQTILADFITPLNVRLIKNNSSDPNLSQIQNQFVTLREDFNHKYIEYSQELESLLNIDCSNEPVAFYHRLESTRNKRSEIITLAEDINKAIDQHQSSVNSLKDSLKEVQSGQ